MAEQNFNPLEGTPWDEDKRDENSQVGNNYLFERLPDEVKRMLEEESPPFDPEKQLSVVERMLSNRDRKEVAENSGGADMSKPKIPAFDPENEESAVMKMLGIKINQNKDSISEK